jgi:hypothetical protein
MIVKRKKSNNLIDTYITMVDVLLLLKLLLLLLLLLLKVVPSVKERVTGLHGMA